MTGENLLRCIVLWFPDWQVTAWSQTEGSNVHDEPVAVIEANTVIACSESARHEGVRSGQRRRDAQARCHELRLIPSDPARDRRVFMPVVDALEQIAPGVQVIQPGVCAVRMRGPTRYYEGEQPAALALLHAPTTVGIAGAQAGIADGVFTARQAALLANPLIIVPEGSSAEFLAPLPIAKLGDDELVELLPRLGVHRLGEFAALDAVLVHNRFGDRGSRLHALAGGSDSRPVIPRIPEPELSRQVEFEPPLELVDQVAFAVRTSAEEFVEGLARAQLVCTEINVTLSTEQGEQSERVWLHPSSFDSAAVVDRVRWQLESAVGHEIDSGVVRVRLEPVAVDAISHHEPGLFGNGPDERVHHALSRVQAMLGHTGVVTSTIAGGRWLAERQLLVPWGDRSGQSRSRDLPWPGSLSSPLPASVFPSPMPVQLLGADGGTITVNGRGLPSTPPCTLVSEGSSRHVVDWAGPWPIDERAWDLDRHRRACRFQVVDDTRTAWLLVLEQGRWAAEGRYD